MNALESNGIYVCFNFLVQFVMLGYKTDDMASEPVLILVIEKLISGTNHISVKISV